MEIFNKINDWRAKVFVWIGLPVIAGIGLLLGVGDLGPAWQAKGGGGTTGTFTAVSQECSRRSCTWHGDFVADGGAKRADVILYDAPDTLSTGETAPALDTGARKGVFAAAGGSTWLLVTALTLAGLVAAVAWVLFLTHTIRRHRAQKTENETFANSIDR